MKPVFAVDIDEVLVDFMTSMAEYHNKIYGTNYKKEDFFSYEFNLVWGGSIKETVDKVHDFYETEEFKNGLKPIEGAREVLEKYKDTFDFQCVTSRPDYVADVTKNLISKLYPDIFSSFHFGSHYTKDSPDPDAEHHSKKSKPDMCKEIDAVGLIDDSYKYATHCVDQMPSQFTILLFGNYAWNQAPQGKTVSKRIKRLLNWAQVDAELEKLANRQQGKM
eukprot:maker-scaffold_84-snap-gene-0.45-mRNA-1 protein AED:0.00 eAED:0.00 QI:142/1/1/1/1/1/3/1269/219